MSTESEEPTGQVFFSYASVDRERALHIADLLEAEGIAVWIDRHSIPGGTSWSAEIVRGIEHSGAVLLLVTPASMASPNIQQEMQLAWDTRRPILPLVGQPATPPEAIRYVLAGRQWIELDQPEQVWVASVVSALRSMTATASGRGGPAEVGERPRDQLPPAEPAPEAPATGSLPPQTTAFIGREREVAALIDELEQPDVRLVTLTGPGGVGKTRLALEVLEHLAPAFPDGIFFVPLATVSEPELVAPAIAQTLGIRLSGAQPVLATLQAHFRHAAALLLLDNYEQVAESRQVPAELLAAAPHLKIIVTSRGPLNLYGEREFPVDSLDFPAARMSPSLDQLARFDAVRLFVDRARAVKPDFTLTDANAASVAAICRQLDGLPLAIELAVARIRLFSPDALLARLDHRLKLLTGGPRDVPARQQTLRGLIDWSYDLLRPGERRLFERLSVFVGSFDLEDAEAVCAAGDDLEIDLLDGLDSLVSKSLVRAQRGEGDAAFEMMVTIREYALDRLAAGGEEARIREVHADYFLRRAQEIVQSSHQADTDTWPARLAGIADNLRAALAYLQTLPPGPERDRRELSGTLTLGGIVLTTAGQGAPEAKALYDRALALVQEHPGSPEMAQILFGLCTFYLFRGEIGPANALAQRLLDLAEQTADREALMQAHFVASATVYWLGEFEATVEHAREVVNYYDPSQSAGYLVRYAQNPRITAMADATWALWILGFADQAEAMARETEAHAFELAHEFMIVIALHIKPGLFLHTRDLTRLEAALGPYLERARRLGNPVYIGLGEGFAGWLAVAQGRTDEGLGQIRRARGAFAAMGVGVVEPLLTTVHADACLLAGEIDEGLAVLDRFLAVAEGNQQLAYLAEQYRLRGELLRLATPPNLAEAERLFQQALELARRQRARAYELRAALSLSRLWRDQGDGARGRELLEDIYAGFSEGGTSPDLQEAAAILAER